MKIIKKYLTKKKGMCQGAIKVLCNDQEDIWYLYNIISVGDTITKKVEFKDKIVTKAGTTTSKRIWVMATLEVLKVDFTYDSLGTNLELHTKNVIENKYIGLGQMLGTDISLDYPLTLFKNHWDRMAFSYLNDAQNASKSSEIAAILMEEG